MAATDAAAPLQTEVLGLIARKRRIAVLVPGAILIDPIYCFFAFHIAGFAQRARLDYGAIPMSGFRIHKTHMMRDNRTGAVTVPIGGEARATCPADRLLERVQVAEDQTAVALPGGHSVVLGPGAGAQDRHPQSGVIDVKPWSGTLRITLPDGPVPDWISVGDNRISVTTPQGRFSMTRNRTETLRHQGGWALFFFTRDSPFHGRSAGDLAPLARTGERVDPARSNLSQIRSDYWNNGLQPAWFGVLPQITPVLLAVVQFAFESNTPSATVFGAIVGGGIGLLLTQAIAIQKHW